MKALSATIVAFALALAVADEPPAPPPGVTLSPDAIVRRALEMLAALPDPAKAPTAQQQTRAVEACKFFGGHLPRIDELNAEQQKALAQLGVNAGSAAGDAAVMLAGAKAYWARTDKTKPDDYAAATLALAAACAGDAAAGKEALDHLVTHPSQPGVGEWAKGQQPLVAAAATPVAARVNLIAGGVLDLSRCRGKVVVMDFWSADCPPYVQLLPQIRKFHQARADNPLFVHVGISLDRKAEEVRKAAADNEIPWAQALNAGLREKFVGEGVPHTVVLAPDGRPIWQGHPIQVDAVAQATDFALRVAARQAKTADTQSASQPAGGDGASATRPAGADRPAADRSEVERRAEALYQLARAYLKAGMPAKARPLLEKIVADYPGTPAAENARAELAPGK